MVVMGDIVLGLDKAASGWHDCQLAEEGESYVGLLSSGLQNACYDSVKRVSHD